MKRFSFLCLALALLIATAAVPLARAVPAPTPAPIYVLRLDDTVNAVSAEYLTRGMAAATQAHAALVVLELNTPGGLDTAMRAIIQAIFASGAPVVGYVAPSGARAASAGFYILLSCDVAAMAPGTNTGAAHPVTLGAQPDPIEAAKMQSDADAFMRGIATQRHRNVALAEKGVLQSASFTAPEALSDGLVDLNAASLDELLAALNQRTVTRLNGATTTLQLAGAPRVVYAMSLRQRVLDMDADLAFALLAIGAMLLYLEFSHPGGVVPGVAGVILVVLSLFSLSLLPISAAGGGLLLLALVLFVLEAKFPSHGALAVGGVVAMALGGILLVNSPVPGVGVDWQVAVSAAVGFGAISLVLLELALRARRQPVTTGTAALVGLPGVVRSPLAPAGLVQVNGELWQATTSGPALPVGVAVAVRAVHGIVLEVDPVQKA